MRKIFVYFVLLAGLIIIGLKIREVAAWLPGNTDENIYDYAALTFFDNFDYVHLNKITADWNFGHPVSNGIIGTWPSGLALFFGGSLFSARMFQSIYCVLFASLVFLQTSRKSEIPFSESSLLLLIFLITVLRLPYWHSFVWNLGEFIGAVFAACGLLIIKEYPRLAFLIWGGVIWHCKILYIPLLGLFSLSFVISDSRDFKEFLKKSFIYLFWFLLPLVPWTILIYFKTDLDYTLQWLNFKSYIIDSELASQAGTVTSKVDPDFLGRMAKLEWADYSWGTKWKIIFLIFVSQICLIADFMVDRKNYSRFGILIIISILLYMNLDIFHYFFLNPGMWIKYLQPALFIGLAIFMYLFLKWFLPLQNKYPGFRNLIYLVVFVLLFVEGLILFRNFRMSQEKTMPDYAETTCFDKKGLKKCSSGISD